MECSRSGSSEIYGLGIRLGLYLTWAACQLLHHLGGSWATLNRTRTTGNAISATVILLLTIHTARGNTLDIDYLLVYHLTTTLFLTESYNTLTQSAKGDGCTFDLRPDWAILWHNVQSLYMSIFGAWVWIRGPENIPHQTSPCGIGHGALYGTFAIDSRPWRKFAAAFAILTALVFVVLTIIFHAPRLPGTVTRGPVDRVMRRRGGRVKRQPGFSIRLTDWACILRPWRDIWESTFKGRKSRTFVWVMWALTTWVAPSAAIISAERMISANTLSMRSISDSSGQTIALILGLVNLLGAVIDILAGFYCSKKKQTAKDPLVSHAYLHPRDIITYEDLKESAHVILQAMKDSGSQARQYMGEPPNYRGQDLDIKLHHLFRQTCRQINTAYLFRAAETGDMDAIRVAVEDEQFILDGGEYNSLNTSPLIKAAEAGHRDIVRLLATDGRVDPNHSDDARGTALGCAANKGHHDVVETLLGIDGVDPNGTGKYLRWTALTGAAAGGYLSIVKLLLGREDVDANARADSGATPLLLASKNGHLEVVETLVESGRCVLDARDKQGSSPVDVAQRNGHEKIVQCLIAAQLGSTEGSTTVKEGDDVESCR
ncbi:hypothetical protein FE257_001678 [Aspergillus nanangensis]|uniref:Uncharacterized protein n=1 Tax=Aspergillus nanangensis TaxID=2582783 RepID=A0AAD4CDI9_ASPNN|nr:hypothetical protein FE257_001678 [Aspergillus nanangensis]